MSEVPLPRRPRLRAKCRLVWNEVRERHMLLYPEGTLLLNATGRRVLDLLDGSRTFEEIVAHLQAEYEADGVEIEDGVRAFLAGVAARGLLADAD